MIKLSDLLNEAAYVQLPGGEEPEELISKGFTTSKPEVDPETGKITTTVQYLPKFKQMRFDLMQQRSDIKPFKFSANPDIANIAKEADKAIGKLSQLIFALDKMVELQQKGE
jgi:hypothetical protein